MSIHKFYEIKDEPIDHVHFCFKHAHDKLLS